MATQQPRPIETLSLEDTIRAISEEEDGTRLEHLVLRGIALSDYPTTGLVIPRAEDLTSAQHAVMVVLAGRSGLGSISTLPIPYLVQIRRRWLGIDPPTLAERRVQATREGEEVEGPLWWVLATTPAEEREQLAGTILTESEILRYCMEAEVLGGRLYNWGPFVKLADLSMRASREDAIWAAEYLREILLWRRATPMGEKDGIQYAYLAPEASQRAVFEPPLCLQPGENFYFLLLTAIAAGGGTVEPAWEPYAPFGRYQNMLVLLRGIPEPRREAFLLDAFQRELYPMMKMETALRLLPAYASPAIARATAELLASPELQAEYGRKEVAGWRKRWAEVEAGLPEAVRKAAGLAETKPAKAARSPAAKASGAAKKGRPTADASGEPTVAAEPAAARIARKPRTS